MTRIPKPKTDRVDRFVCFHAKVPMRHELARLWPNGPVINHVGAGALEMCCDFFSLGNEMAMHLRGAFQLADIPLRA